jgi:hypothetical protein
MPSAGTLQNLTVASNSGLGIPITVTVYVNGVATGVTCSFTSNGCSDNSDTVAVSALNTVVVGVSTTSGSIPAGTLSIHVALEKQ